MTTLPSPDATPAIDARTLSLWLGDGGEIALIDVREEGQHGAGHPLLAVNLPYSRLETAIGRLVPRASTRIVLVDGDDGVAARAARRLRALGYDRVHRLAGGVAAWAAAGHALFESVNVPSKAFAEFVEHACGTPAIAAAELDRLRRRGTDVVVLDSRTAEEFGRFHVPGARSCPSAELVHRFADLVPSPETLVVVSCAGRTRGIIGAQTLINAGVPNKVAALAGGTQGWRLAGLELERNVPAQALPASDAAARAGSASAGRIAGRFGVRTVDRATLGRWLAEDDRTTYLLDVRTPAEFAAGHLPGSVSAPGGQLVQATDTWVGTRGARLVLIDDTGTRATTTAHWLLQMGWEVHVADRVLERAELDHGEAAAPASDAPAGVTELDPQEAAQWLLDGAAVSVEPSAAYRRSHPVGAVWSTRPRLDRLPAAVREARRIVVFGADRAVASLAAGELAELTGAAVALARGGTAAWERQGLPVEASPATPADAERIDFLFWNHDRHEGNAEAMQAYLRWETELPGRIERDSTLRFRIGGGAPAR